MAHNSLKWLCGGLLSLAMLSPGLARDDGRYAQASPEIKSWIRALKDKDGIGCCDTADGYPAEVDWDTRENKYRVRIDGQWYVVPDKAVIDGPNKLGFATVWYYKFNDEVVIRCFLPGGGV